MCDLISWCRVKRQSVDIGMSATPDTGAMSTVSLLPLYLARTLAAWGDRTWQFVGGMFMLQLGDSDTSLQANLHFHNSFLSQDHIKCLLLLHV